VEHNKIEIFNNSQVADTHIYAVSELNFNIKKDLESNFSNIWIEGEVSNCYFHNKRNIYFDLKDEYSKIKVVMFYENNQKLPFEIEDGLHLLINGYVSVYEKRGEYQIIALDAKPVGKGSLLLAFEQLKVKLENKGYFEPSRKKKIPILPKTIGVITSIGGAVLHDIISVLSRRYENFHIIVRNVNVQGITSSMEICDAINDLCQYGVDVIIMARGGGSLEDLWAFNTEMIAEKIFNCNTPIVSAIGHETDFTISDFVADLRAATPSIAAEVVILNKTEVIEKIKKLVRKMQIHTDTKLMIGKKELSFLIKRRIFKKPETINLALWQEFDSLNSKLKENMKALTDKARMELSKQIQRISKNYIYGRININRVMAGNLYTRIFEYYKNSINIKRNKAELILKDLQKNSPLSTIERGYALLLSEKSNKSIRNIKNVEIGENIRIILQDGVLLSRILSKISKKLRLEL
jgi:exodeoxyribonuclease VII large subunit